MRKVKNYFKNTFFTHFHLSAKYASGALMIAFSLTLGLFMIDASFFSASLVNEQIFQEEKGFIESVEEFAGVLPDSPFYGVFNKKAVTEDDLLVLFAKVVKAAQRDENMATKLYTEFLVNLDVLSDEKQTELLTKLSENLEFVLISNPVFPQSFNVFSRINKEDFWVNELVIFINNQGSRNIVRSRAEIIFRELAAQRDWQERINSNDMISELSFIKYNLENPVIDGEVFHAAAEDWMKENAVWNSL